MGIFEILKQSLSMKNDEKMRIGLSSFKTNTKKIENATALSQSITNKDIRLSDLMRRTSCY
jgi:hypothetical protein